MADSDYLLENYVPVVKYHGLNTDTAVTFGGAVTAESTLAVTGATTVGGTLSVTDAISGPFFHQTDVSAATIAVTTAMSGGTFLATKGSATQTYTLPAAAAGLRYTFICGHADGEILINPTASDDITITTFAAVGADADTAIVTTTGATGIKNTAATNAVGDSVTLVSDGTKWFGVGITSGIWAAQ